MNVRPVVPCKLNLFRLEFNLNMAYTNHTTKNSGL